MPVTLRDVLNISSLSEMKLIAGSEGLDSILTWPVVCHSDRITGRVYGGELLFITGVSLRADAGTLKSLISEGSANNLVGIVFSSPDDYDAAIDESVIDFAVSLAFPIFQILKNVRLVEIVKDMTNFIIEHQNEDKVLRTLMEKTISSAPDEIEGLKKRIARLGYNVSCAYQAAMIKITRKQQNILDDARYKEYIHLYARNLLNQRCYGVMTMSRRDDIVIFVPVSRNKNIYAELIGIRDAIMTRFIGAQVTIGIGSSAKNVSGLQRSLIEAENEQKMHNEHKKTDAAGPGMLSLFYDTLDCNEIETYCDKNIGKLIDYDRLNDCELVRTIEVYFENKFNLTHTAKALMIHRNSLMYRLRRIEEIIGRKLDDPYAILDIVNSIFIKKALLSVHRATG